MYSSTPVNILIVTLYPLISRLPLNRLHCFIMLSSSNRDLDFIDPESIRAYSASAWLHNRSHSWAYTLRLKCLYNTDLLCRR